MTNKSSAKGKGVAAFLATLALSGITMLWSLWHFPKATLTIAIAVLAAFAISARLAHDTDADASDMERGERIR